MGGSGPRLHFSHANGYPPETYRQFLAPFTADYEVTASLHRPLWTPPVQPASVRSWAVFGDDLEQVLARHAEPVVAVGHSMGGSALMMVAARRPELFSALVLIEPVLVSRRYLAIMRLLRTLSPGRQPMVAKTLRRVDNWPSRQAMFAHFRPKPVFARISDEGLWDFVNLGTQETAAGSIELRFSKEWEAHCYGRVHNLWPLLPRLTVPVLAIRGERTNTLLGQAWQKWQRKFPRHDFLDIAEGSHLVPFEQPSTLAAQILKWLDRRSSP